MTKERCKKCGGRYVRRSSSELKHWIRVATASPRRFCPICSRKWSVASNARDVLMRVAILTTVLAIFFAARAGFLASQRRPVGISESLEALGPEGESPEDAGLSEASKKGAKKDPRASALEAELEKREASLSQLVDVDKLKQHPGGIVGLMKKAKGILGGRDPSQLSPQEKQSLWAQYKHLFQGKEQAYKLYRQYEIQQGRTPQEPPSR